MFNVKVSKELTRPGGGIFAAIFALAALMTVLMPHPLAAQSVAITVDVPEIAVDLLRPDGSLSDAPTVCQDRQPFSGNFLPEDALMLAETRCRDLLLDGAAFNIKRSPLSQTLALNKNDEAYFRSMAQSLTEIKTASFEHLQDEAGNAMVVANIELRAIYPNLSDAIKAGIADHDYQTIVSASLALEAETLNTLEAKIASLANSQTPITVRSEINTLKALQLLRQSLSPPKADKASQSRTAQIEQMMNQAAKLDPDNPLVFYLLGENQLKTSRSAQAVASFTHSLKLAPELAPALLGRGTAYLRLNLLDLAIADYDKALKLSPDQPTYHMARASALLIKEDFPAMCRDFKEACSKGECEGYHWATSRGYCE